MNQQIPIAPNQPLYVTLRFEVGMRGGKLIRPSMVWYRPMLLQWGRPAKGTYHRSGGDYNA